MAKKKKPISEYTTEELKKSLKSINTVRWTILGIFGVIVVGFLIYLIKKDSDQNFMVLFAPIGASMAILAATSSMVKQMKEELVKRGEA